MHVRLAVYFGFCFEHYHARASFRIELGLQMQRGARVWRLQRYRLQFHIPSERFLARREPFGRHLNLAHEPAVAMDQQLHCCGLILLHERAERDRLNSERRLVEYCQKRFSHRAAVRLRPALTNHLLSADDPTGGQRDAMMP